ncbi:unnamed protein product [Phytomonas sp. EM1]|nr:unnamed protein product [Phytomonas sp. EM1]|eukprot:CCW61316.1 unnamed protein product [Phytomonas sp. isolate EM1]
MLWLSARERPSGADSPDPDVMQRREQHLLREVAKENAEVTTMQFLILSMEVTVWNVASLLLLMVPVESLGDPSQVWSAILRAVEQRYVLLSAATASDDETALPPSSIAAESASARQLLWLQLESLVQMLWTLQRKQAKARGGVLHGSNQQLHAGKSDVDLLIRLAWERREGGGVSKVGKKEAQPLVCMPTLTQACVGAIGLLCVSFGEVEATLVGASFALAILASYGNDSAATAPSSLLQLDGGMALSGTSHLANPAERRAWLQRLFAVDGIVSARVEAANALMDFFLDERYDIEVYIPQGVHQKLSIFLVQLREYIKQRLMISKFWKRNYQIVAEPEDFEQWQEIEENLVGFLEYKAQHIRDLRKH